MTEHSVAILEDHPLLAGMTREVIEGLLTDCEVFIFPSIAQLTEAKPHVDFLVIDLHLDDANDSEVLETIKTLYPDVPGIVYTSQSNAEDLAQQFGYTFLDKRSNSKAFFNTLVSIFESTGLVASQNREAGNASDKRFSHQSTIIAPGASKPLTLKQVEIMECCRRGLSAKETARELDLGVETVRAHMSDIFLRLQVKNAPQAVEVYVKAKRMSALKSGLFAENEAIETS